MTTSSLANSEPIRKMLFGIFIFLVVCVTAMTGYMLAGWSLMDSIYMVVITIFGVGYGEVRPVESAALRGLTIAIIVAGYASVIYTVGGFVQLVIDGELNRVLGARRMTKGIDRLSQHTIVCGLGRLGSALARELQTAKTPLVVVDSNLELLQGLEESGYLIVHGDATDDEVLERAGIRRAATLASVLSDDAANVFVTITARAMNPKVNIIARGENPRTEKKLLGCGANRVILPTAIGAQKVAQLILRPNAENLLEQLAQGASNVQDLGPQDLSLLGLEFQELKIDTDSPLLAVPLGELVTEDAQAFLAIGIRRHNGTCELHPTPDTSLAAGDTLICLSHHAGPLKLVPRPKNKSSGLIYRGVKTE